MGLLMISFLAERLTNYWNSSNNSVPVNPNTNPGARELSGDKRSFQHNLSINIRVLRLHCHYSHPCLCSKELWPWTLTCKRNKWLYHNTALQFIQMLLILNYMTEFSLYLDTLKPLCFSNALHPLTNISFCCKLSCVIAFEIVMGIYSASCSIAWLHRYWPLTNMALKFNSVQLATREIGLPFPRFYRWINPPECFFLRFNDICVQNNDWSRRRSPSLSLSRSLAIKTNDLISASSHFPICVFCHVA